MFRTGLRERRILRVSVCVSCRFTKTGCQVILCVTLPNWSPLTGHASESTQHENAQYLCAYKLQACGPARLSDVDAYRQKMRPLMRKCFDLLSLKSSRGPLPAMEGGGGTLSFIPLTHIFLSSPSFFASRHLSPLQLFFFFILFATAHPLKHLSSCAIHH